MCLQTDNVLLAAQEDIVCYKLYVKSPSVCGGKWFSPFARYYMPEFGKTIESIGVKSGVHSFSTMEGVIRLTSLLSAWIMNSVRNQPPVDAQIVKCIIPKNSEFYQGIDSATKAPALQSMQLTIVESIAVFNKGNYWEEIERLKQQVL